MFRHELEAWCNYLVGKPCPIHPNRRIMNGTHGLWCGSKDEKGRWCDGGEISQEFLENLRKEKV